jgi:predicted nucleic acid-binding protein
VIYVDTSVLLAQLLAEDRRPPRALFDQQLIASRLAEYEVWNRIHGRNLADSHGEPARQLLARISIVELSPVVLRRALDPFPLPVRTLDALHLASLEYLRAQHLEVALATYDERMVRVATEMSIPLEPLNR